MSENADDLLRPSLQGETGEVRPITSPFASYVVGFLGGPFAIGFFTLLDSLRLRRGLRELWFPVLCLGVAAGILYAAPLVPAIMEGGASSLRLVNRVAAILLAGVAYLMHARFHRAMDASGTEPASPWVSGIVAVLVSVPLTSLLAVLLFLLFPGHPLAEKYQ